MKTTIAIILLSLAEWTTTARVSSKVSKRGIYNTGSLYGSHGILFSDPINAHNLNTYQLPKKFVVPAKQTYSLQPQLSSFGFTNFGSFLPKLEQSTYNFQSAPQSSFVTNFASSLDSGYNYPVPVGPRFEEGPIPSSFDYLIPPAIRPVPIPNPKLDPGYRAPTRRILTATNQGLFYQYPGYIPEPGLTVRLPIPMARPTRIVVPQHGPVAFGSGGLGYRSLPGGRVALGSGGLGLANLAMARSNPLPVNPQSILKPNTPTIVFPASFSIYQRGLNNFLPEEAPSSNSLTVFPLPDDEKRNPTG